MASHGLGKVLPAIVVSEAIETATVRAVATVTAVSVFTAARVNEGTESEVNRTSSNKNRCNRIWRLPSLSPNGAGMAKIVATVDSKTLHEASIP